MPTRRREKDNVKKLVKSAMENKPPTLYRQTQILAKILMDEFGGPTHDEGAIDMAIRVLRHQKKELTDLHLQVQSLQRTVATHEDKRALMEMRCADLSKELDKVLRSSGHWTKGAPKSTRFTKPFSG